MKRITSHRAGFTLVELLVVIAIIGVLATLITVAAYNALVGARRTRIKLEIDTLHSALEKYKAEFQTYPPDFSNQVVLNQHIAKRFPNYIPGTPGTALPPKAGELTPAQSLVFWLGEFNSDPYNPFLRIREQFPVSALNPAPPTTPARPPHTAALFEFDKERLKDEQYFGRTKPNNEWVSIPVYLAPFGDVGKAPYVYFDSRTYYLGPSTDTQPNPANQNRYQYNATSGIAVPYVDDANKSSALDAGDGWVNPKSFQLISAGMDGVYGQDTLPNLTMLRLFPTLMRFPANASPAIGTPPMLPDPDNDNVANFTDRAVLEDAKP